VGPRSRQVHMGPWGACC